MAIITGLCVVKLSKLRVVLVIEEDLCYFASVTNDCRNKIDIQVLVFVDTQVIEIPLDLYSSFVLYYIIAVNERMDNGFDIYGIVNKVSHVQLISKQ